MRTRLKLWAPAIYGSSVSAACAFIGARFSNDQRLTSAMWSAGGMFALCLALYFMYGVRSWRKSVRAEAALGRRAATTYVAVIQQDGSCRAQTIANLLESIPPTGGVMRWDRPYLVSFHFGIQHLKEMPHGQPE